MCYTFAFQKISKGICPHQYHSTNEWTVLSNYTNGSPFKTLPKCPFETAIHFFKLKAIRHGCAKRDKKTAHISLWWKCTNKLYSTSRIVRLCITLIKHLCTSSHSFNHQYYDLWPFHTVITFFCLESTSCRIMCFVLCKQNQCLVSYERRIEKSSFWSTRYT